MSSLNIDQLIELVHKKPQLWDRSNKFHSNRHVLDKSWREIAVELNADEFVIRKKWKYLRDQFSVEFGKIPPAGCGDELLSFEPKWRFYKPLQFLEEVVTPRVNTKNPRRDGDSSSQDTSPPGSPSPAEHATKPSRHRMMEKKKHKRHHRDKRALHTMDEEHMHFFKSLLPHVRTIPPHLQLSFRNRVQQLVEEFVYRSEPGTSGHTEPLQFPTPEPFFITYVQEHGGKFEPPESLDETLGNHNDDSI